MQLSGSIKDEFGQGAAAGDHQAIDELLKQRKEKPEVKVENFDTNQVYLWTPEKFRERLILMRDMMHQLGEHGLENPFADDAEPLLIGEVFYKLEALANLIDNPISQHIIGTTYGVHGRLDLNIIPCNPDGTYEDLDFIPDEPADLID